MTVRCPAIVSPFVLASRCLQVLSERLQLLACLNAVREVLQSRMLCKLDSILTVFYGDSRSAVLIGPLTAADAELLGGSVEIGNRGGINVKGHELKVPLEAE